MDLLNRDKWETKYLDNNQGSAFHSEGEQKPKSIMCFNCVKLGHIVPEYKNPVDSGAISSCESLMQK